MAKKKKNNLIAGQMSLFQFAHRKQVNGDIPYIPLEGWIDLSKLTLPAKKFKVYAKLQRLGDQYQRTYAYQKQHNEVQLKKLKNLCAEMQTDLIFNYHALELV